MTDQWRSPFNIQFYTSPAGNTPVIEFLRELKKQDKGAVAKCDSYIDMLRKQGFKLLRHHQYAALVSGYKNLYELRPEWRGVEYRLYFTHIDGTVTFVMVHAINKQAQKAPKPDLDIAAKRAREVKNEHDKRNRS